MEAIRLSKIVSLLIEFADGDWNESEFKSALIKQLQEDASFEREYRYLSITTVHIHLQEILLSVLEELQLTGSGPEVDYDDSASITSILDLVFSGDNQPPQLRRDAG